MTSTRRLRSQTDIKSQYISQIVHADLENRDPLRPENINHLIKQVVLVVYERVTKGEMPLVESLFSNDRGSFVDRSLGILHRNLDLGFDFFQPLVKALINLLDKDFSEKVYLISLIIELLISSTLLVVGDGENLIALVI